MKMKTQNSKPMGFSKSSAKRKVHSNTSLPKEKEKNKCPDSTPKTSRKRRNEVSRRTEIIKIIAKINEKKQRGL